MTQSHLTKSKLTTEKALIDHMIDYYQYIPLKYFLKEHAHWETPQIADTLTLVDSLINVDLATVEELAPALQHDYLLQPSFLERRVYSYNHYLYLSLAKREIADYLRGLTPLLVDVFRLIIEEHIMPELSDYIVKITKQTEDGRVIYKGLQWNEEKIKAKPNRIQSTWQHYYGDTFNYKHYISSSHLLKIIEHHLNNDQIEAATHQLRQIEKNSRNIIAHEILYVDEAWLLNRVQLTSDEIHQLLINLINMAGLADARQWNAVNHLNDQLRQFLNEQNQQLNDETL